MLRQHGIVAQHQHDAHTVVLRERPVQKWGREAVELHRQREEDVDNEGVAVRYHCHAAMAR